MCSQHGVCGLSSEYPLISRCKDTLHTCPTSWFAARYFKESSVPYGLFKQEIIKTSRLNKVGINSIWYFHLNSKILNSNHRDLFTIFNFNYNISICIVFNFNSSSDKFQLTSYDFIIKMMSWLSSTCIQNFPPSLVVILKIDNYFKHTEIALIRQYTPKIVWPFG